MNKPKFFAFALVFISFLSFNAFSQTENTRQPEPNYEVVLQTLIASNDSSNKPEIPANLSETVGKLKKTFTFNNYRLISTNFQRVANTGNINHKSLFNSLNSNSDETVFSTWNLSGLRKGIDEKGAAQVSFQSFAFDARVPVKSFNLNQEGRSIPITSYESIGISLQRFNVPENIPTLISTLSLPKSDEIIFFVLTVKPAQ